MTTATGVLRDEHRVILRALLSLEIAAGRLEAGDALPAQLWAAIVDWLRVFADRNHHGKEEDALFPAMIRSGLPMRGSPVDVMLEEHAQGRALLRSMETGADAERAAAARRYVGLLRDHIEKENGYLFPLADAVLDEPAQARLLREFARAEAETGIDGARAEAAAMGFAAALQG
jgi:hemerythrin-like domain-containing protein